MGLVGDDFGQPSRRSRGKSSRVRSRRGTMSAASHRACRRSTASRRAAQALPGADRRCSQAGRAAMRTLYRPSRSVTTLRSRVKSGPRRRPCPASPADHSPPSRRPPFSRGTTSRRSRCRSSAKRTTFNPVCTTTGRSRSSRTPRRPCSPAPPRPSKQLVGKIEALEQQLARKDGVIAKKDEVIAWVTEEHIKLKTALGEP